MRPQRPDFTPFCRPHTSLSSLLPQCLLSTASSYDMSTGKLRCFSSKSAAATPAMHSMASDGSDGHAPCSPHHRRSQQCSGRLLHRQSHNRAPGRTSLGRRNSSPLVPSAASSSSTAEAQQQQPPTGSGGAGDDSHETDVVVIGSGVGGLCCAALLAKYGFRVTVCESHDVPGGCAHSWVHPKGYHFESGPSLYSGMAATGPAGRHPLPPFPPFPFPPVALLLLFSIAEPHGAANLCVPPSLPPSAEADSPLASPPNPTLPLLWLSHPSQPLVPRLPGYRRAPGPHRVQDLERAPSRGRISHRGNDGNATMALCVADIASTCSPGCLHWARRGRAGAALNVLRRLQCHV